MALLRNSQLLRGAQRCLVLWQGLHVADTWLRLDELAHCPEKVAEYDAAAHSVPQHRQRRRLRAVATGAGTCDPDVRLMVPTAHRVSDRGLLAGAALVAESSGGRYSTYGQPRARSAEP